MIRGLIKSMLCLSRYELAIAEYCSSNFGYIRRLRNDVRHWDMELFKYDNARRFA